jgi:hypothetical protein
MPQDKYSDILDQPTKSRYADILDEPETAAETQLPDLTKPEPKVDTVTAIAESTAQPMQKPVTYKPSVTEQNINVPDKNLPTIEKYLEPKVAEQLKQIPKPVVPETPPISTEQLNKDFIDKPDILQTPAGRLLGSFGQGVLGVGEGIAGAGEYFGIPGAEESANALSEWQRTIAPDDPNFVEQLSSGAGSMAVFLPFGLGVGTAAKLMSSVSPKVAGLIGMSGATFLESATEAGNVYRQALTETKDESEASRSAEKTFLANMLLVGLTNKFGAFNETMRAGIKKALLSAPLEALQEGGQEIISSGAQGKEPDWESIITAGAIGGIIGGGAGMVMPGQDVQQTINVGDVGLDQLTDLPKEKPRLQKIEEPNIEISPEESQLRGEIIRDLMNKGETVTTKKVDEEAQKRFNQNFDPTTATELKGGDISGLQAETKEVKESPTGIKPTETEGIIPEGVETVKPKLTQEQGIPLLKKINNEIEDLIVSVQNREITDFDFLDKKRELSAEKERIIKEIEGEGAVQKSPESVNIEQKEKQPYEMTQKEFVKNQRKDFGKYYETAFEIGGETGVGVVGEHHKKLIAQALKENKSVPPEVLKDYPDLAEKYAQKTPETVQIQEPMTKKGQKLTSQEVAKEKAEISSSSRTPKEGVDNNRTTALRLISEGKTDTDIAKALFGKYKREDIKQVMEWRKEWGKEQIKNIPKEIDADFYSDNKLLQGKAKKILTEPVRSGGKVTNEAGMVEDAIKNNLEVRFRKNVTIGNSKPRDTYDIFNADGTIVEISKTAYDYYNYLKGKPEPKKSAEVKAEQIITKTETAIENKYSEKDPKKRFENAKNYLTNEINTLVSKSIEQDNPDLPDFMTKEKFNELMQNGKIELPSERGELTKTDIANEKGYWGNALANAVQLKGEYKIEIPDDGTVTLKDPTLGYLFSLEKDIKSNLKYDKPVSKSIPLPKALKAPLANSIDIDRFETFGDYQAELQSKLKDAQENLATAKKSNAKALIENFQTDVKEIERLIEGSKRLDWNRVLKDREAERLRREEEENFYADAAAAITDKTINIDNLEDIDFGNPHKEAELENLVKRYRAKKEKLAKKTKLNSKQESDFKEMISEQKQVLEKSIEPVDKVSFEAITDFNKKLKSGEVTADELREQFQLLVDNKDKVVKSILAKLDTMDKYKRKRIATKQEIAKNTYDKWIDILPYASTDVFSHMIDFSDPQGGRIKAVGEFLSKVTDDQIKAQNEKNKSQTEKQKKIIENPETLEELREKTYYAKLTPSEQAKLEDLEAVNKKEKQKEAQQREASNINLDNLEITEDVDTRDNSPLWVGKVKNRLSSAEFKELSGQIRKIGGYWSRYKNGFIFKENPESKISGEIPVGKKPNTERIRGVAESLREKASDKLNQDRQENTARRARMADHARDDARKDLQIAETMLRIADALDAGEVKLLDKLSAKTEIEQLESLLVQSKYKRARKENLKDYDQRDVELEDINYAEMPIVYLSKGEALKFLQLHPSVKGSALLRSLVRDSKEDYINIADIAEEIIPKLPDSEYLKQRTTDDLKRLRRLRNLGITNDSELRAYLREYFGLRNPKIQKSKDDLLKEKERDISRSNIPGFFPTPIELASELVEDADIQSGMTVLEPSAGKGNIADAITTSAFENDLDVIEYNSSLEEILSEKGYNVVSNDFLDYNEKTYDRIVMNPPFENGQDIEHVKHAYELLNPNGKLVAIMSEGTFFRNDKQAAGFREWLNEVGGVSEKLAEGSFKSAERPTGVATRKVIIDKFPVVQSEEPVHKKEENLSIPSGANAVKVEYQSGKKAQLQIDKKFTTKDITVKTDPVKKVTYGKITVKKGGAPDWTSFKEIKPEPITEKKRENDEPVNDTDRIDGNVVDFGVGLGQAFTAIADNIKNYGVRKKAEIELGLRPASNIHPESAKEYLLSPFDWTGEKISGTKLERVYREFLTAPAWFVDKNPEYIKIWDAIDRNHVRYMNYDLAVIKEDMWKNGKEWRKLENKKEFIDAIKKNEEIQYNLQKNGDPLDLPTFNEIADKLSDKGKKFVEEVYQPTIEKALEYVKDLDKYKVINVNVNRNPYLEEYYDAKEFLDKELNDVVFKLKRTDAEKQKLLKKVRETGESRKQKLLEEAKKRFFDLTPNSELAVENAFLKGAKSEVDALNKAWLENKDIREIAADDLVEQKYKDIDGKFYFPSSRLDKKYYLSGFKDVTNPVDLLMGEVPDRYFTTSDNPSDLLKIKRQLEKDGYEVKTGKFKEAQEEILKNVVTQEDLLDLAILSGIETDNKVLDKLLKNINSKGFKRHFVHKRYIPGFEFNEENFETAIHKYINSVTYYKNRNIGNFELNKTTTELKEKKILKPGSNEDKYIEDLKRKLETRDVAVSKALRAVASMWYLALKPSYLIQQLVQPLNTLLPNLPVVAQELGIKQSEAEKAFGESMISTLQYWTWKVYDKAQRLRNKETKETFGLDKDFISTMKQLERMGVAKPLRSLELLGEEVNPAKYYNPTPLSKLGIIPKIVGLPGIMIEDFTRTQGIRAYYNLAKKAGMQGDKLLDYISLQVARSYGAASGVQSKPPGFTVRGGNLASRGSQAVLDSYVTFKNFAFMNYGQWGKVWRELRNNNLYRPLIYKVGAQVGLGGLKYMMWTSSILAAMSLIHGFFDIPEDPEKQYEDLFKNFNKLVPGLGDVLYKGLASVTFKVDLSGLFAQTAPLEEPFSGDVLEVIGGAPYSAAKDIVKGEPPSALKNIKKAKEWREEGVKAGSKVLIPNKKKYEQMKNKGLKPEKPVTDDEKLKKSLGFTPERVSDVYQKERTRSFASSQMGDIIREVVEDEIIALIEARKHSKAIEKFKELFEQAKKSDSMTELQENKITTVRKFVRQYVINRLAEKEKEVIRNWEYAREFKRASR